VTKMASMNPFDLLGDDAEDPSQQIVAEQLKVVTAPPKKPLTQPNKPAQLPTKPTPPTQAGLLPSLFLLLLHRNVQSNMLLSVFPSVSNVSTCNPSISICDLICFQLRKYFCNEAIFLNSCCWWHTGALKFF